MKKYLYLLIPLLSVLVCSLVAFSSLDNKISDLFQRALKPLKENDNVIMINVDDNAVDMIGTWPFSRDVYSDALITLKDLGAEAAVFDLSFIDKSQSHVNKEYIQKKLPEYVDEDFSELDDAVISIFGGLMDRSISSAELPDYAEYYSSLSESERNKLKTSISYSIEDVDKSLANNLKFFDNSYLTLTFNATSEITDYQADYLKKYIALDNITVADNAKVPGYEGVQPAIPDFMEKAKKAGFVNADADSDGYLRHLYLVMEYNGSYYGQLLLVPILNYLGNPKIEVHKNYILLKNCRLEDMTIKDIRIPLDKDGKVIIKYPKNKSYYDYKSVSFWNVYRITSLEREFYDYLCTLRDGGYFSTWDKEYTPLDYYDSASYIHDELCNGESEDFTFDSYRYYKNEFYNSTRAFIYGDYAQTLADAYGFTGADYDGLMKVFSDLKKNYERLVDARDDLQKQVRYAFCIIGTCATSTTDFGLTQYEEKFPNPGVHYALANQLLNQDFINEAPVWGSILIAFILCFGYSLLIAKKIKSTGKQIILGGVIAIISIGALLLIFVTTKTYIGTAVPVISFIVCFVAQTVMNLINTSKDKKFITGAFSQCLSPDVVQELVDHPESFKLGGESYDMSAIFTDIQKFSGFSELLSAAQLVSLLNYYLTRMSDIIMEEGGTVDKYEGDAIVALVGAPLKMEDHASRACSAAIKMKKAEISMNKEIADIVASGEMPELLSDQLSNKALFEAFKIMVKNNRSIFTRIGINSGNIVAGYMGSDKKKNYTMMGNNVNLASRLEGVNKQYHTGGILVSAATRKDLSDDFVVRSLDRVQVVNVKTPIRLYEVIGFKSDCDENTIKYMGYWETAIKTFEKADYATALAMFKKLSEARPSDNVAKYYIELTEKFFVNGKYPTDQDDFGVEYNAENPQDMDPSWIGTENEIKGTFKLLQK